MCCQVKSWNDTLHFRQRHFKILTREPTQKMASVGNVPEHLITQSEMLHLVCRCRASDAASGHLLMFSCKFVDFLLFWQWMGIKVGTADNGQWRTDTQWLAKHLNALISQAGDGAPYRQSKSCDPHIYHNLQNFRTWYATRLLLYNAPKESPPLETSLTRGPVSVCCFELYNYKGF